MLGRFLSNGRRDFDSLSEQEILALAISSEEDDIEVPKVVEAELSGLQLGPKRKKLSDKDRRLQQFEDSQKKAKASEDAKEKVTSALDNTKASNIENWKNDVEKLSNMSDIGASLEDNMSNMSTLMDMRLQEVFAAINANTKVTSDAAIAGGQMAAMGGAMGGASGGGDNSGGGTIIDTGDMVLRGRQNSSQFMYPPNSIV